ncbi:MAG: pilus assembly FimT family protein [Burkholderiaceae bacterium]
MMRYTAPVHRGFTLVEAIIVIAVTGIVAAVVAVFIRAPVESYFDSVSRAELSDVADVALRRMTRDLRLALPNSIRVVNGASGNYVEFLLTSTGGRYLDQDDGVAGNILDFNDVNAKEFDVIGPAPQVAPQNQVVVYNLGIPPADAYSGDNRAAVSEVNGNTIKLATNPFAAQPVAMRSPGKRFQVVTTPVSYGCVNNQLIRYSGYPILAAQNTPPGGAGLQTALMATGVTGCAFSYGSAAQVRTALVGLTLTLTRSGESVTLFHQVHVDNTP